MNVGGIDRILRIAVGLILILGTPQLLGYIGSNWAWLGLLPLLTGLLRTCPAYKLIGMNTCPMKK
ncbi:YgaP family membrane protein [Brachymonas denitrificans]|uniref:Inner membrane protein YgaP-like transmembrane domain-containing protein n=1 Tax=Brachymonas denitrificans DSM 15123 TaxID=1121117 RepID=A0A1H8HNT2_9BURK|nr:DUF2892 domain-containing protein [Brachymonas denitrificans]SEN57763.1 Protein of unknown function [Brachymonas denitrificans DSM 15123]